jgi:hypothetical protein
MKIIGSALFYFIILTTSLTAVVPSYAESAQCSTLFVLPIPRAPFSERLKSKALGLKLALIEPQIGARANALIATDRERAHQVLKLKNKNSVSNLAELLKVIGEDDPTPPLRYWRSKNIRVGQQGSTLSYAPTQTTADNLKSHFGQVLPSQLDNVTSQVMDVFYDSDRLRSWMSDIHNEVLQRMWDDQIHNPEVYRSEEVRELYLDAVLAERAARNGFSINEYSLPFDVVTFNEWSFFRGTLAKGKIFIDWTGVNLAVSDGVKHYARGHLLEMVYASENVPNFIDLMKYVGQTNDRDGVWELLFDNSYSPDTPFWGGRWLSTFKNRLRIRY